MIGGNHGARAKLQLWKTYQIGLYSQVEAWIYCGLTKEQIKSLAWGHNLDQEYRKGMSTIDRIRACHKLFEEVGFERSAKLKLDCARECSLPGHELGKPSAIHKHNPFFQLCFRTGIIWDLQEEIFQAHMKKELKNQKKPESEKLDLKGKGKGKAKDKTPHLVALADDLKASDFRCLQGLNDVNLQEKLLRRVLSKDLSLSEMALEGKKYKDLKLMCQLFVKSANCRDWDDAVAKYPKETSPELMENFLPVLKDVVSPNCIHVYI